MICGFSPPLIRYLEKQYSSSSAQHQPHGCQSCLPYFIPQIEKKESKRRYSRGIWRRISVVYFCQLQTDLSAFVFSHYLFRKKTMGKKWHVVGRKMHVRFLQGRKGSSRGCAVLSPPKSLKFNLIPSVSAFPLSFSVDSQRW